MGEASSSAAASAEEEAKAPPTRSEHEDQQGTRVANFTHPDPGANMEIDPMVEKRLRRKFDRSLLPLVFVAYLLAFLDRSNIGNAETAGMSADLGFDDAHFQVG
jgi:hypothetical protein